MAQRQVNSESTDDEKLVVDYLSRKIDPIFVPMVKTLVAKVIVGQLIFLNHRRSTAFTRTCLINTPMTEYDIT